MKRKLALVLSAVMMLGVAACTSTPADTATPATAAPATEATAAPGTDTTDAAATTAPVSQSAGAQLAAQYGLPATPLSDADPIDFTFFSRDSNDPFASTNKIISAIETITNTNVHMEFLVGDEATKIGAMVASGDMDDGVFVGGDTGPFITAGDFIPLEDLMTQNAPNLVAHYQPWWDAMMQAGPDGSKHIYIAEAFGTPSAPAPVLENWNSAMWIQKDILDQAGKAPTSVDEYFDMITNYRNANPTIDGQPTRGFEILATGNKWIDNPPLFLEGYPNWGGVYVDETTNTAYERWTPDWVKTWFKKLNDEYQIGTVPKDTLTLTTDQYMSNLASGTVLGMHDQLWAFNSAQDPLKAAGKYNRTFLPLALTYDGKDPNYMDLPAFTGNNGVGISTSCKDPVRLIQFMDYCIQEPVQKFLTWGIEGENYTVDDNGRMVRSDEQRQLQSDATWVRDNLGQQLYNYLPKMQGAYSDGNACQPGDQPEEYFAALNDYDKALFTKLGIETQAGFMGEQKIRPTYYPVWSMTIEDGSPAAIGNQQATDVRGKYYPQLITCDPAQFDTVWAQYVDEMSKTGIQDYITEVNKQIQDRLATWNGVEYLQ